MKVLTFSRHFPSYHPRKGQPTFFVEKIKNSLDPLYETYGRNSGNSIKVHTIRAGHRWKAGDWFKPVVWGDDINPKSGRSGPYHSKHVQFQDPIQVKKTWDFDIKDGIIHLNGTVIHVDGYHPDETLVRIAHNDGLALDDLLAWFKYPSPFDGQIICWNDKLEY